MLAEIEESLLTYQDNMLAAAKFVDAKARLPLPQEPADRLSLLTSKATTSLWSRAARGHSRTTSGIRTYVITVSQYTVSLGSPVKWPRMVARLSDPRIHCSLRPTFTMAITAISNRRSTGVSHEAISEGQRELPAEGATEASSSKLMVSLQGYSYECCLRDLTDIIHYIYDLTDYQFELVRSVFTFTPDYTIIDAPYQINQPKRMYQPKTNGKKDMAKNNGKNTGKKHSKDNGKNNSKKEGSYNRIITSASEIPGHILEQQIQEQKELQEIEEREREVWLQKNSILPLSMAVDEEFFQKYFPSCENPSAGVSETAREGLKVLELALVPQPATTAVLQAY
ncbi:hypothetical protein EVAR_101912_1 [Eumeta japonica]|uniref:Uncharacterized protein n=1 Tax=Eumeta variegata TaxID=151549 RepID=A0A4C1TSB0_EUMVA|nr:hypothetical protein EVAR_101912_1 [Eumeta japonica]